MKRVRRLLAILGVLSTVGGACSTSQGAGPSKPQESAPAPEAAPAAPVAKKKGTPQPTLPTGTVVLEAAPRAPVTLKVEVANNDSQRQMGLMFREHMGDDEGMLFLFPTERHNSFWMHNTLIPLDMYFIDSEWKVVGVVENATPETDDPRNVEKMSQYVLEVNAGFAKRHGLAADTQVRFTPPPELANP